MSAQMNSQRSDRPIAEATPVLAPRREFGVAPWVLRRILAEIRIGRLTVVTPEGRHLHSPVGETGPQAILVLKTWGSMWRLLLRGDIGFAEAYRDGEVETPDLTALIELCARNDATLRRLLSGIGPLRVLGRLRHLLNANSRSGSSRNIMAHYDLGNAFYGRWLDASMTYSAALYEAENETLEGAQRRKLDRIVGMLDLSGGEHVLEIGCGWGALAERLAREGCRVTAITLSPAQREAARARIADAGLADRVEILLCDYRDVSGDFDRVVSIEMIEAVGRAYWPTYFATLARTLKPAGRVVLQSITIDERVFDSYLSGTDFIQRHVFPGGCLPSAASIEREAAAAGLATHDRLAFGPSYALTLREWRRRFHEAWPAIAPLGFDEAFRRLWDFYLCYCEAGFRAGTIDVGLTTLRHSHAGDGGPLETAVGG